MVHGDSIDDYKKFDAALQASGQSSFMGWAKPPLSSLHETLEAARSRYDDPKSCEAVYYNLFKDNGEISEANPKMITSENLKEILRPSILSASLEYPYSSDRNARDKLLTRFDATQISLVNYGIIGETYKGCAENESNCEAGQPPHMDLNEKAFSQMTDAAKAFWVGHESTHNVDFVPKELSDCLASSASIGARKGFLKFNSPSKIHLPKNTATDSGGGYGEGSGTELIGSFEILTARDPDLAERLLLGLQGKKEVTLSQKDLKLIKSSGIFNADRGGILPSKLFALPDQMIEAAADYNGINVAVKFIESHYSDRKERRQAALSILKSIKPLLYTKTADHILSQVGSKMPYEHRVFRILLANPKFRALIGCDFSQSTPIFCSASGRDELHRTPAVR